ncbi:uncharacterized protein KNAG_0B06900 [Huiozyma naganishii CBS 8797]|uniref:Nudix hydrolase domain-containing protein n=1 Tax=Huiozyma naganishii (strain ATCC MYA-139 / BCRC 22969 / CBS 8797 / KCTC 17520 / NBRC 10181 / NCYC 3082 / Yp74L-3) TaxID=1071383 RepID=J7S464_HUIN7|nr:hypothetical protein KNAG_0B06900 [Kazachstania naganishii CBS 8797]CCK69114.1 hypothetical protein KNAG_0B06900 [Kazachstania naganishii CBS 8797]
MVVVQKDAQGRQVICRTDADEKEGFTFLSIMDKVDVFPPDYEQLDGFKENVYYLVTHHDVKVGFVCRFVLEEMMTVVPTSLFQETFTVDNERHFIRFNSEIFETRNTQLDQIARLMQKNPQSKIQGLKGWRDEQYAIWIKKTPYVLVERALSGALGIITLGAHINGYVIDYATQEIKLWISRRAATKPTWPLMLDNIIAGGLGYPYGPYETAVKESLEEANLEKPIIERYLKSVGVVSYFYYQGNAQKDMFNSEGSFITGEAQFLYDLELPPTVIPEPNDGEVDSFTLMSLQEVVDALKNGEFKPNCAMVTLEFLIRHGYVTAENEPNYLTILSKMHRRFPFPTLS